MAAPWSDRQIGLAWAVVLVGGSALWLALTWRTEAQRLDTQIQGLEQQKRELRADTVRAIAECQAMAIEHEAMGAMCKDTLKQTLELNNSAYESLKRQIAKLEERRAALPDE